MAPWIIGAIAVVVIVLIIAASTLEPEEKGPMPKRHGGFGQRVHGGKS
jgi:hypothetical protein